MNKSTSAGCGPGRHTPAGGGLLPYYLLSNLFTASATIPLDIRISYLFSVGPLVETVKFLNRSEQAVGKCSRSALEDPDVEDKFAMPLEEPTPTSMQLIQHLGRVFPWSIDLRTMDSTLRGLRF